MSVCAKDLKTYYDTPILHFEESYHEQQPEEAKFGN